MFFKKGVVSQKMSDNFTFLFPISLINFLSSLSFHRTSMLLFFSTQLNISFFSVSTFSVLPAKTFPASLLSSSHACTIMYSRPIFLQMFFLRPDPYTCFLRCFFFTSRCFLGRGYPTFIFTGTPVILCDDASL